MEDVPLQIDGRGIKFNHGFARIAFNLKDNNMQEFCVRICEQFAIPNNLETMEIYPAFNNKPIQLYCMLYSLIYLFDLFVSFFISVT